MARPRKITPGAVVALRRAVAAGERQEDVAARFGITQSMVSRIATGARYLDDGGPITRYTIVQESQEAPAHA